MEHRLSCRYAIDRPVDIFHGKHQVVQGRTRNVSRDGALLVTNSGSVAYHAHIELELRVANSHAMPRRLRGVVVHREDEKIGVLFLEQWNQAEWDALTDSTASEQLGASSS